MPSHLHALSATFTPQKVDYVLKKKFIMDEQERGPAWNVRARGQDDRRIPGYSFPQVEHLPGQRRRADAASRSFRDDGLRRRSRCDTEEGWEDAPGTKGRYLVGLPEKGETGLAFGGPPPEDGALPVHAHAFEGGVTLPTYRIAGAGAHWYAGKGTYTFSGMTKEAAINLPYVALRQCVRR